MNPNDPRSQSTARLSRRLVAIGLSTIFLGCSALKEGSERYEGGIDSPTVDRPTVDVRDVSNDVGALDAETSVVIDVVAPDVVADAEDSASDVAVDIPSDVPSGVPSS